MEERHRADAGPHPDLLGQRRRLADQQVGAGKLVRRLERQEGAVLADPGFRHAEPIGDDDLMQVLVVADLGHLVVAVAVREDADLHRQPRLLRDGRPLGLRLSSSAGRSLPMHCQSGGCLFKSGRWADRPTGCNEPQATSRMRRSTVSWPSISATTPFSNRTRCSCSAACEPIGESAVVVDRTGGSTLIVTPAWDAERAARLSVTANDRRHRRPCGSAGGGAQGPPDRSATNGRRWPLHARASARASASRRCSAATFAPTKLFVRELARIRSAEELAAARKATGSPSAATSTCSKSCVPACASSSSPPSSTAT